MTTLLDQHPDVIVSGTADNPVDFYDRFGHVVLLSVPLDVAIARVNWRTAATRQRFRGTGRAPSGGRAGRPRRASNAPLTLSR
ncbi:hypothetical protein HNP40_002714 [Mycobacteroides chelonae]|nr:hypothetical protein [Mycobacteroides chelonae]